MFSFWTQPHKKKKKKGYLSYSIKIHARKKTSDFEKKHQQFDGRLVLQEGIEADQVYNKGMSYGQWANSYNVYNGLFDLHIFSTFNTTIRAFIS